MQRKTAQHFAEQGPIAGLALPQSGFSLLQSVKQMIEALDQFADFVLSENGQGLKGLHLLRHGGQCSRSSKHRRELSTQYPPGQAARQQRQYDRGQQHTLLHVFDRGKCLGGGQVDRHDPARRRNALVGGQHFHAQWIDNNRGTLVAVDETVDNRVDAGRGKRFHNTALVGSGDNQPELRSYQQIAAGFAVTACRDLIQETRKAQVGHS